MQYYQCINRQPSNFFLIDELNLKLIFRNVLAKCCFQISNQNATPRNELCQLNVLRIESWGQIRMDTLGSLII